MPALSTGASSGIGYALAKAFASHGYDVVRVAHSKAKLAQLAQELRATYGIKAVILAQDLSVMGARIQPNVRSPEQPPADKEEQGRQEKKQPQATGMLDEWL